MVNGEGNANMENKTNMVQETTNEVNTALNSATSNENIPTPDLINYFSNHMNVLLQ